MSIVKVARKVRYYGSLLPSDCLVLHSQVKQAMRDHPAGSLLADLARVQDAALTLLAKCPVARLVPLAHYAADEEPSGELWFLELAREYGVDLTASCLTE